MKLNINTKSRQDYETPNHDFEKIQKTLSLKFTLDLCASKNNSKCEWFVPVDVDLFSIDLKRARRFYHTDLWMNPPYQSGNKYEKGVADFLAKAEEIRTMCKSNVAVLVNSNITSAKYFSDIIGATESERKRNNIELYFPEGRIKFMLEKKECNSNPLASMVVLFKRGRKRRSWT